MLEKQTFYLSASSLYFTRTVFLNKDSNPTPYWGTGHLISLEMIILPPLSLSAAVRLTASLLSAPSHVSVSLPGGRPPHVATGDAQLSVDPFPPVSQQSVCFSLSRWARQEPRDCFIFSSRDLFSYWKQRRSASSWSCVFEGSCDFCALGFLWSSSCTWWKAPFALGFSFTRASSSSLILPTASDFESPQTKDPSPNLPPSYGPLPPPCPYQTAAPSGRTHENEAKPWPGRLRILISLYIHSLNYIRRCF